MNKTSYFRWFLFVQLLMIFSDGLLAQDKVEFSLDGEALESGPIEKMETKSIDSAEFDKAFQDQKKVKKMNNVVKRPDAKKSGSAAPVSQPIASRPIVPQTPSVSKSEAVKVDVKKAAAPPSSVPARVTSRPGPDSYWNKVVRTLKKGYQQGRIQAEELAKKLKMKWLESTK